MKNYRRIYTGEIRRLKIQQKIEAAKLAYFDYLHDKVDYYPEKCHSVVSLLIVPKSVSDEESIKCSEHVEKIKELENQLTHV